jgi:hypothetical protein
VNDENPKQQKEAAAEPGKPGAVRPVSERKARANRENAKKSTGPKTARGKRNSSFNAIKHGLLTKKVLFAPDGKLANEDLRRLMEDLRDGYGCGDVASELFAELAAVDYWRLAKGLEYEQKYLSPQGGEFHPQGGMPTLVRYMTASRRNLESSLPKLIGMRVQKAPNGRMDEGESAAAEPIQSIPNGSEGVPGRSTPAGAAKPAKNRLAKKKEDEAA